MVQSVYSKFLNLGSVSRIGLLYKVPRGSFALYDELCQEVNCKGKNYCIVHSEKFEMN